MLNINYFLKHINNHNNSGGYLEWYRAYELSNIIKSLSLENDISYTPI